MAVKIRGTGNAANPSITGDDDDTGLVYGTNQIDFSTGGTTRATINSDGDVLIGRTSTIDSSEVLGLKGPDGDACTIGLTSDGTTQAGIIGFNDDDANFRGRIQYNHNGDSMVFHTAGSERMRVDSSGKLGIGTTSPSDNLHVADSGATEVYLRLSNSTVSNGWSLGPRGSDGRFQLVQNGVRDSLAISTDGKFTAPTIYSLTTSGGSAVYVESDGDLLRYTSSLKYKTDIETLEDKRADNILNCRPVWYKSTCNNDIKTKGAEKSDWGWYGFIAEEIAEIDPRLVNWATKDAVSTENGSESVERDPSKYTAEGVRYDNFVPLLVNLLKRQKEQIEILETKVAALEAA